MSNKQSPFNDINYEWTYGSDGWNVGMDENMVKLSFLSVKVVDSFEAVLPPLPVIEGRSCVLPDNTVHFYVNSTWFTITPTDGEIWVVADKEYQIVAGVFSEVLQATTLEATVTPKIDKLMDENKTLSLGNISGSATVTLDGKGYVQATVIGATTFIFNDAPISGEFTNWYLELEMTGDYTVTFPATVWDGGTAPVLGTSGKYVINFKTTPTSRFGSVEVGGVNTETSQGSFIGSAVVIPGTNPTTSTSLTNPPDIVTTQAGDIFLRENRVALLTDLPQVANIRNYAPWLEVPSYITDLSTDITWLSGVNVITGKIVDYLWDEDAQLYVVLARDVSGTGSSAPRARILTTTDFKTFTKTTGLDVTNLSGSVYTYLKRIKNIDGVVNYVVIEGIKTTGGTTSIYRSASYTATTWTSVSSGPSFSVGAMDSSAMFHLKPDSLLMSYTDNGVNGARNIRYANGTWTGTNVLGSVTSADIIYAEYDGFSKWYMSRVDGVVIDQTATSIGISFVGGTTGATTIATAPIIGYVPELEGWFAIEQNPTGVVVASTYAPKVYFRPDVTAVWGQIGELPVGFRGISDTHSTTNKSWEKPRLLYWEGKLYILGLLEQGQAIDTNTIAKYTMISEDGGATWATKLIGEQIMPRKDSFTNIMGCSADKNKPSSGLFRLSNAQFQYTTDLNFSPETQMIVETNSSAASPLTTTVYTRIV